MCCDERALHISGMLGEQVHSAWLKVSWGEGSDVAIDVEKRTLLVGTRNASGGYKERAVACGALN
jgi:hypothetical protein